MAKNDVPVPPVPVPPPGDGVPQEPAQPANAPATPAAPEVPEAPEAAPVPPVESAPAAPRVDPYATAGAAAPAAPNPYAAAPGAPAQPTGGYPAQPQAANPYGASGPVPGYAPQGPVLPQGLSIASMVCGIAGVVLSLFSIGLLPAVAAIIMGHMAVKRQPHAKPFWLTGIITGYVGIGISIIWFLAFIVPLIMALFMFGSLASFS